MFNEPKTLLKENTTWLTYYKVAWFIAGIGIFSQLIMPYVGYRALGSVYLLAILTVSILSTRGPIFFAAIFSALSWNYFFMPPRFTLIIAERDDLMMLIVFFVTAIVAGNLAAKIKKQEVSLEVRQERMNWLYDLSKVLAAADSIKEIKTIFKSVVEEQFEAKIEIYLEGEKETSKKFNRQEPWPLAVEFELKGKTKTLGKVLFFLKNENTVLTDEEQNYLKTIISQVAVAIERYQFSESVIETKFLKESQKLHQTLLNSVSHELRTPITAIIGTATALQNESIVNNSEARSALTTELVDSSMRLERVVENLLGVARLENDALNLKKEWFEISELVESAINTLKSQTSDRPLIVRGEAGILMEGDFKLLEHALKNIVLNAHKYTPKDSQIEVRYALENEYVKVSVVDEGPGFPNGQNELLFEKFYRVPGTPAGGLGLGLSIVKSIVELHDGKVEAINRIEIDGNTGAIFEIKLPNRVQPELLKGVVNASKP